MKINRSTQDCNKRTKSEHRDEVIVGLILSSCFARPCSCHPVSQTIVKYDQLL